MLSSFENFQPWTKKWEASEIMIRYLIQTYSNNTQPLRAIDVGAGVGHVGLEVASHCSCFQEMVLTDIQQALSTMQETRQKYPSSFSVQIRELDWTQDHHATRLNPPFDVVICSDLVYFPHLFDPLIRTLDLLTDPTTSTVYFSYRQRQCELEFTFFEKLGLLFDLEFLDRQFQPLSGDLFLFKATKKVLSSSSHFDDQFWIHCLSQMQV